MDIVTQKQEMRREIRGTRRKLDPDLKARWDGGIQSNVLSLAEYREARTVFCYVAYGGEPETKPIILAALRDRKRVLVPLCRENGRMDAVEIRDFADLKPGMYGILEPEGPAVSDEEIDFAVVPAVACDEQGGRLGQGGGYYDRFFIRFAGRPAVLCYERFLVDRVPREAHDQPVELIVTESRVIRPAGRAE